MGFFRYLYKFPFEPTLKASPNSERDVVGAATGRDQNLLVHNIMEDAAQHRYAKIRTEQEYKYNKCRGIKRQWGAIHCIKEVGSCILLVIQKARYDTSHPTRSCSFWFWTQMDNKSARKAIDFGYNLPKMCYMLRLVSNAPINRFFSINYEIKRSIGT